MAKQLGFGVMRLPITDPANHGSIDMPTFERMVDLFIDRGFSYFDTAWIYHEGKSEEAVREAVVKRHPRDSFTVTTKMPTMVLEKESDHARIFEAQLRNVGVDCFDYYLLHDINIETWPVAKRLGTFEYVAEQRRAGRIAHMGFSFHDTPEMLDEVLNEHPEVDFVQLQINYLDWDSPAVQARRCYECAVRHGKKVIVMEPVKGGQLARIPAEAQRLLEREQPGTSAAALAIRYAASLSEVMMVLSGMSTLEQVDENTSFMGDFTPLSDDERKTLVRVKHILADATAIPCTNCRYCVSGCPQRIPIPDYFALFNAQASAGRKTHNNRMYYEHIVTRGAGKASECIGCRKCAKACPQHIMIPEMLKDVAAAFEG